MFKKTHIKTIMIFFVLGIILITGLGIINILNLNDIKVQVKNIETMTKIEQRVDYLIKLTVFLNVIY